MLLGEHKAILSQEAVGTQGAPGHGLEQWDAGHELAPSCASGNGN